MTALQAAPEHPDEPTAARVAIPVVEDVTALDIVQEWGLDSFPASDPPANW